MKLNRRNFLAGLGLTGLSGLAGTSVTSTTSDNPEIVTDFEEPILFTFDGSKDSANFYVSVEDGRIKLPLQNMSKNVEFFDGFQGRSITLEGRLSNAPSNIYSILRSWENEEKATVFYGKQISNGLIYLGRLVTTDSPSQVMTLEYDFIFYPEEV